MLAPVGIRIAGFVFGIITLAAILLLSVAALYLILKIGSLLDTMREGIKEKK